MPTNYAKSTFSCLARHFGWVAVTSALAIAPAAATTVVINDDFSDGTVTGWMSQGNGQGIDAHNITESGSVLVSEVVANQGNTNRGIVSVASFDPGSDGFSMDFVVASVANTPGANGYFIGAVNGNDAFYRDADLRNFGLTFFGQNARTGSGGGFGLHYADNNGGAPSLHILGNSDTGGDVDLPSLQDGFSASVQTDTTGWSYSIDGLSTAAGVAQVFADSGTWADAGTDYATLFGADNSWHATGSFQFVPNATHTVSYDSITVAVVPEPSSAFLALLAGGGLLFRRRRA